MKIDLVNLNYDICSKEWKILEKSFSKFNFPPLLEGIFRTIFFTLKSLGRINFILPKKSIIFLVGTHNQNLTLSKVANKTDNSILLGFHNFRSKSLDGYIPSFFFYFVGWIFFPHTVIKLFRIKDKYQRGALIKRLERALVSGSSILVWKFLFWFWNPSMIVISNDHNHWTRSAIKAAKQMNIKSSYIPHAYTSKSFPELECSYSFLDSEIQKKSYKKEGVADSGIIKVVGAVRFENIIRIFEQSDLNGILICFNTLDSKGLIHSILRESATVKKNKYSIFVKPHPADVDRFSFIEKLCDKYDLTYVTPTDQICDFSCKAQVLLGGVSGAHIDGLMCGMLPISFSGWYEEDYFGLVSEGIVQIVEDFCDINESYSESFQRVLALRDRYNYHLVNPQILPSQLIADHLNSILKNA